VLRDIGGAQGKDIAIKVLESFQINSKLVWDCHRSLMQLAEHNKIQLIRVSGHMGIYVNEQHVQVMHWSNLSLRTPVSNALQISSATTGVQIWKNHTKISDAFISTNSTISTNPTVINLVPDFYTHICLPDEF
jgi:hypothetical protein